MDVIGEVVTSGTIPLQEYAMRTGRTFPQVLERAGRGVVRRVMGITPPAKDPGRDGALRHQDQVRGRVAIARDLNNVFVPVKIKNQRRGRISGAEMVAIHQRHLAKKRPGAIMKRDRPQPYFVDRRLFRELETKLRSHVGRLAAGWLPAAAALRVSTPTWVSRHGLGRGTYRADFQGRIMYIESVNHASTHAPADELRRRVPYALRYQANAMHRELQDLLLRDASLSGLKVA